MELLSLVVPNSCSVDEINCFRNEFLSKSEEIPGGSGLYESDDLVEWVLKTEKDISLDITSRVYFARRKCDHKLVGIINLRYPYEGYVKKYGHIGYAVRPSERKKRLGSVMLQECLLISYKFGLERVLITCDDDNLGSQGIIKQCGGVQEIGEDRRSSSTLRFWINTQQ